MIQWIFFNDLPINSFMFDRILLNCTNMTILFVFIHFYNNGVTRKEQTFMGEYTEQYCYAIKNDDTSWYTGWQYSVEHK